jgi:flagellar basal body-associated protein FliL
LRPEGGGGSINSFVDFGSNIAIIIIIAMAVAICAVFMVVCFLFSRKKKN